VSDNVFFRIVRLSLIILIILVIVYGYYLHTKGALLPFMMKTVLPNLLKIIKDYGIVIIIVISIFSFGFYCGKRHGSRSGNSRTR